MLKRAERLNGVNENLCKVVKKAAEKANFNITVSEGLRTKERQQQLYNEGLSKTLNSKHIIGMAVDLYPLTNDGEINWSGFENLVQLMKQAAKELNIKITCGYDWGWDKPHYEL